jgi:hypothetical protein
MVDHRCSRIDRRARRTGLSAHARPLAGGKDAEPHGGGHESCGVGISGRPAVAARGESELARIAGAGAGAAVCAEPGPLAGLTGSLAGRACPAGGTRSGARELRRLLRPAKQLA